MARLLISLRKQKQLKENFLILTPLSLPVCLPIICYSGSVDGWHICAPKTPIVFCFHSFSFLFCIIKLFLSDYFSSGTKYALVFPIIGEQWKPSLIPISPSSYFHISLLSFKTKFFKSCLCWLSALLPLSPVWKPFHQRFPLCQPAPWNCSWRGHSGHEVSFPLFGNAVGC